MGTRSEYRRRSWFLSIWVCILIAGSGIARADLIDDLCNPDKDPTKVIEALVEEAEATGMPLSTLNRLLAVGYRDANAIADLRQLLCTIVILEEQGLPPEPLFEKLEEGLGKRVPLKTIQAVIMRQVEKLEYAQQLVAGNKTPLVDDVNVQRIADLMDIGISRGRLDHLFGSAYDAPTGMRTIAAEIIGYGSMTGFPDGELNRIVSAGLTFQSLTPEWAFFIKVIKEARAQKIPDIKTANEAVRTLSKKESMDVLIDQLGLKKKRVYHDANKG